MTPQTQSTNRAKVLITLLENEFGISHNATNGEFDAKIDGTHLKIKTRANTLVLHAALFQGPVNENLELYKTLLSLSWNNNTYFEEAISLESTSNEVTLSKKVDTYLLTDSDFLLIIERFLNTAEYFYQGYVKLSDMQTKDNHQFNIHHSHVHHSVIKEA